MHELLTSFVLCALLLDINRALYDHILYNWLQQLPLHHVEKATFGFGRIVLIGLKHRRKQTMDEITRIASALRLKKSQVTATVALLDEGNTVPFIARYRKEVTGGLDDEQVQLLAARLKHERALAERRQTVLNALAEQEVLTPQLQSQVDSAETLTDLEEIYAPFKRRRQTRADVAREAGLQPFADLILEQPVTDATAAELSFDYLNPQAPTAAHVFSGARDIVAQMIADNTLTRQSLRRHAMQSGVLTCTRREGSDDPKAVYKLYYDFEQPVSSIRPHQTLAINRGENEGILSVSVSISEHDWLLALRIAARPNRLSPLVDELRKATEDARKRLLQPAIERAVRRELTDSAENHAIAIFAQNLQGLLSQPPLIGHVVLGIDPGFRTGCKVAVVDPTGKLLDTATIYPHQPQKNRDDALKRLALLVRRHDVTVIAIGNGTASRETEQLVAELTRTFDTLHYLTVNEAGASVYSASDLARSELPELDVTLRGAVSIARRVLDPLAELVKIDPQSIGVGLYQHDVNQTRLSEALADVVTLVVNRVGVDVNTASPALLQYVAGIGPSLSQKIVAYRDEEGPFANRSRLHKVSGLGPKTFEQAAGFLRIRDGDNPLDASAIHPESYKTAQALLEMAAIDLVGMDSAEKQARIDTLLQKTSLKQLSAELETGEPTLTDICEQLVRPGRDPREDLPTPLLRDDVVDIEQLSAGLQVQGTVRNIVDFGVFIDIGVKRDGLLHRSQIPRKVTLNVGDIIDVVIKSVDTQRNRISLAWPKNK